MSNPNKPPWFKQPLPANSLTFLKWYMLLITASMLVAAMSFHWQGYPLPSRLYWLAIPLQAISALIIAIAAQPNRQPRTDIYLLLLLCSMLLLGWFLHDSGGHTNPLISLLLLPVAMASAILSWQASILMAACAIGIYTALTEFYLPLNSNLQGHESHQQFMQLHLLGMWITFGLSALLLLVLVQPLAASLRKQKERIAQQREDTLRDEQLIALATFSASAAHKMGTPLSTLSILVEDLKEFHSNEEIRADLNTMESQIQLCKSTLHEMMRKAEHVRNETVSYIAADELLKQLQQQFTLLHPQLSLQVQKSVPNIAIISTPTLEQALLNLLDNAAKASESNPKIWLEEQPQQVGIIIQDHGPGMAKNLQQEVGKPFLESGKSNAGLGLGLFLSNATINRLGGTLKIHNNAQGTLAEVWLPKQEA